MKKTLLILLLCLSVANAQEKPTCKGKTQANEPCKSFMLKPDGYCAHHSPSSPRCGAKKADGQPCKMLVKEPGQKCYHHKN